MGRPFLAGVPCTRSFFPRVEMAWRLTNCWPLGLVLHQKLSRKCVRIRQIGCRDSFPVLGVSFWAFTSSLPPPHGCSTAGQPGSASKLGGFNQRDKKLGTTFRAEIRARLRCENRPPAFIESSLSAERIVFEWSCLLSSALSRWGGWAYFQSLLEQDDRKVCQLFLT